MIISPMLSLAKTLHAYMTLWKHNDVRESDANSFCFEKSSVSNGIFNV